MNSVAVFDNRPCELGEGVLWHPEREELFWFDILGNRFLSGSGGEWKFNENVSATGWLNKSEFLIASENRLFRFNIDTGAITDLIALEDDDPTTRSNDGRADPWGGFWIGTMGKSAEPDRGAIYRYYKGELRRLFAPITIPNAICFDPENKLGYFTDSRFGKVMQVPLHPETGWPTAGPDLFIDLAADGLVADGAVIASDGTFVTAQWGASRVARYGPNGGFVEAIDYPTAHVSCPALGGRNLTTLYATTARENLSPDDLKKQPQAGMTFSVETGLRGTPEPRVRL